MSSERTRRHSTRRAAGLCIALAAVVCTACGTGDPGYAGRSTRDWVAQLSGRDPRAREEAVDALGRVLAIAPHQHDAVRALIRALGDSSDDVRVGAALALAKEGVRADSAIPGLAAVARDSAHPFVRKVALETLGRLTHSLPPHDAAKIATPIANALRVGLDDPDRSVRLTALTALGGMRRAAGAAAPAIAPRLVELTRDVDPNVRIDALNALAAVPASSDVIAANAVRMLADPAARVRVGAVGVLQELGTSVTVVLPAIVGALRDRDPDVRRAAAVALGFIRTESDSAATGALVRARLDPDPAVRLEAAHSLTGFHQRGGQDPPPPEPRREELCRNAPPGARGC